jgi:isopentenyl diphosphate isomerase/L-lactate dehydrogenase-like FMN-dependent dehydrogenase
LAAGGTEGVVRMLEILEDELVCAMGLIGTPSIKDVTPKHVTPAYQVTTPHEMSSWVNKPLERIL